VAVCSPHPSILTEAQNLGSNPDIITSYKKVQGTSAAPGIPAIPQSQNWFFTKNNGLAAAQPKPANAPASWANWNALTFQQRIVIGNLGGFDANTVVANPANLAKVAAGYANWPAGLYATFWAGGATVNTCNIYVGETLFADVKSLVIGDKYASASQIYHADETSSPLRLKLERLNVGDVQPGDIAAWDYGHVEIVSAVNVGAGTFCSIGGWRPDMGTQKCAGTERQLALASSEPSTLRFYRWCVSGEEPGAKGCGCNPWTWW
jgi:hypothetical protein